jgi:GxxExxY protein
VYAIAGAAMEVYNTLGTGFLEPVYQEALEIEMAARCIPFIPQKELRIFYKEHRLEKFYVADFLVFDKIAVEIKALDRLSSREQSQLLNYLKATGLEVGVLINFGAQIKL